LNPQFNSFDPAREFTRRELLPVADVLDPMQGSNW